MKTVTVMKFRKSPGYFFFRVLHDKISFLLTHKGKPCAKLVPHGESDTTIISTDGKIQGEKPLTFRRPNL